MFSKLLAAATLTLFPEAWLVRGFSAGHLFVYEFRFPFPFQSSMLSLIEERIRLLQRKEGAEFQLLEMTPRNAAEQMRYLRQQIAARRVEERAMALVQMVRLENFVDYCEAPLQRVDWRGECKLLEWYTVPEEGDLLTRIVGTSLHKADRKNFLKQAPCFAKRDHRLLVQEMALLAPSPEQPGCWTWLPSGEEIRQRWWLWWQSVWQAQGVRFVQTPLRSHRRVWLEEYPSLMEEEKGIAEVFYQTSQGVCEGLFRTTQEMTDRAYFLCSEEALIKRGISFLQFIRKIPRILGFERQVGEIPPVLFVLYRGKGGFEKLKKMLTEASLPFTVEKNEEQGAPSAVAVQIADGWGRLWDGPRMELCAARDQRAWLVVSLFGSWERMLALLLERTGGVPPVPESF